MKSLRKTLTVASFVMGNLIGAGFFMMPAAVAHLGHNLIWSWIIGASIAFIFALIFGKLYVLYPNSKDLSDFFEDMNIKQTVAILYWLGIIVGNIIVFSVIVSVFNFANYREMLVFVVALIFFLSISNHFFYAEDVDKIEGVLSFLKFLLLFLIPILVFFSSYNKISVPVAKGGISDVFQIGVLSFWSFMGIETAGVFGNGKEAQNGLLIGILACFILYISSCFLIVGIVPFSVLTEGKDIPLVALINHSKLSFLSNYVRYLIAFTSLASLYGWFATSSKIALSFAKSGVFPSFFLKETRSDSSFWGLWGSSILTLIGFWSVSFFDKNTQFELIADFCVNISLIIFAMCANVLYFKSNSVFDFLLSLLGIILIVLLLSIKFCFSLFTVILFVLFYYFCKYFIY
ncbi:amino acid permease [Alphaproteobacteria bacterium endosymbiont of Tiliacea citrago]|uniref:amino acid permease n=1 Tax=Alphaproteobacteria bacterium endosymbiont of Tiliacea citrago TaxID=3077944 RepID=UPI00313EA868